MDECIKKVTEFHRKYGFPVDLPLAGDDELINLSHSLAATAADLKPYSPTALRVHLIVEEAAELAAALSTGDEVGVLDALADLLYVTVGTAVTFGLPLAAAFDEVHRSNLTKTISQDRPGHPGKSLGYSSPDLASLLTTERGGR
jgi:phosphoribosyl-ATP pyrophosphohydrolase